MISRQIAGAIRADLYQGKALIITGPRQVGKTTLLRERIKANAYAGKRPSYYFWRTTQRQEIDRLEEEGGQLQAFEFTWNSKAKARFPASFQQAYPGTDLNVVSPDNYMLYVSVN